MTTDKQQPPAVQERPRKQNEKDYLLRYRWMYTGPSPHQWTDPVDGKVYSRAEALKVQQQRKPIREYSKGKLPDDFGAELPSRVSTCPRCGQPPMRELVIGNRVRFYCRSCPTVPASEGETFEEVARQWNDVGWRWDSRLNEIHARRLLNEATRNASTADALESLAQKEGVTMEQQQRQWDFNGLLAFLDAVHKSDVTAAKRDLVIKALTAIDSVSTWDGARAAVLNLFTDEGIEVEKKT